MTEESCTGSDIDDITSQFDESIRMDPSSLVAVWSRNSPPALSEIANMRNLSAVNCTTPSRGFRRCNTVAEDTDNTASCASNAQYYTPNSNVTFRKRRLQSVAAPISVDVKESTSLPSHNEDACDRKSHLMSCSSDEQKTRVPAKITEKTSTIPRKSLKINSTGRSTSKSSSTREMSGKSLIPRLPSRNAVLSHRDNSRSHVSPSSKEHNNASGSRSTLNVKQSPLCRTSSPRVAFGSTIPKEVRLPYQQRIEGVKPTPETTPKKALELRAYPGPSGTTPVMRQLTVPKTPDILKRRHNFIYEPKTPNVFERLSQPIYQTPIKKKISACPNTVSNGIRVASVVRKRM